MALNEPAYVVGIKPETNTVVVGPERALYAAEALADELMLTSVRELEPGRAVLAKIRYKADKVAARAYPLAALLIPLANSLDRFGLLHLGTTRLG